MVEGKLFVGEDPIGTFEVTPHPEEKLVVTFRQGLRVGQLIELATEAGTPVFLMAIPTIDE